MSANATITNANAVRFHALAWPHLDAVQQMARYITRNETEADDLTQETMLKAFRRIDRLREQDRAQPWLRTILRNTHIDHARILRKPEVSLEELEFDPPAAEGDAQWRGADARLADPDLIIDQFADEDVIRAVRGLPRDIRWTLLLVDVQGISDAEAAEALRIPVGTVKSRLHRGRNMLRVALRPVAEEMRMAI